MWQHHSLEWMATVSACCREAPSLCLIWVIHLLHGQADHSNTFFCREAPSLCCSFCLVLIFPEHPTWMALYTVQPNCADEPLWIYSLTHSLTACAGPTSNWTINYFIPPPVHYSIAVDGHRLCWLSVLHIFWLSAFYQLNNCCTSGLVVKCLADKGRSIAPLWPRLIARLQRSAGGRLVSVQSWSTHLLWGQPGRRHHWLLGGRPSDIRTD